MISIPNEAIAAMYLIKTHFIMRVLEFHPEDQTVDLIEDVYEYTNSAVGQFTIENEYGVDVTVALKRPSILYNIPVKQERWGQFSIQCCPVEGDTGYIEIMTNDIRDWMENGSESIPWSDEHFNKNSCVFVPFVPHAKNCDENYPEDNTKLIIKSKNVKIEITDDDSDNKKIDITADKVGIEADVEVTGDITVTGNLSLEGDITVTNGDVVADGISLKHHVHTSAAEGSPTSEPIGA